MSDEAREASDTLCDVVREYIIDHGCEVVVHVNEVPHDLWDEISGRLVGPSVKRELVHGGHVIEYWRQGA